MMFQMLELRAERSIIKNRIDLYLFGDKGTTDGSNNKSFVGKQVQMELVEDGLMVDPILSLTKDEAQQLMDELWHCGMRPAEGTGSAGRLSLRY